MLSYIFLLSRYLDHTLIFGFYRGCYEFKLESWKLKFCIELHNTIFRMWKIEGKRYELIFKGFGYWNTLRYLVAVYTYFIRFSNL